MTKITIQLLELTNKNGYIGVIFKLTNTTSTVFPKLKGSTTISILSGPSAGASQSTGLGNDLQPGETWTKEITIVPSTYGPGTYTLKGTFYDYLYDERPEHTRTFTIEEPPGEGLGRITSLTASPSTVNHGADSLIRCTGKNTGQHSDLFKTRIVVTGLAIEWGEEITLAPGESKEQATNLANITSDQEVVGSIWRMGPYGWVHDDDERITITVREAPVICTPGTQKCIGYDLHVCNTAGTDWDLVEANSPTCGWEEDVVICTPGAQKCENGDLYTCGESGTVWHLTQHNAPICQEVPGCPDFFTDPIGAVVCWIIGFFENALGFISGGFLTLIANVSSFLNSFSASIADFFSDPISKVQSWVSDIIPTLSDWWDGILSGIGDWWTDTIPEVTGWISDAVSGFTGWIDEGFSNIGDWWNSTLTSLWASINNLISVAVGAILGGFASIGDWWNSVISSITTWINDAIDATVDFILDGFNSLGDWWTTTWSSVITWVNDAIAAAGSWVTSGITDFAEWLSGLGEGFIDWINGIISDLQEWVEDIVPGIVEGMLGFLQPIVQPIIDAVEFLGSITGILTSQRPKEPEIKEAEEAIEAEYDAIKEIVDGME